MLKDLQGKKYLCDSDLDFNGVDLDTTIPLIAAGVSWGKTTYAIEKLPDRIQKKKRKVINNVLFLTPNRAILEQTASKHPEGNRSTVYEMDFLDFGDDECAYRHISVACFAKPGQWLEWGNTIDRKFDLVILDECHRLVEWSRAFQNNLLVWDWIKSILGQTVVVGLTGTPQLLLSDCMQASGFKFVDVCRKLSPRHKAVYINIVPWITIRTVVSWIVKCAKPNGAVLIYTKSAKECYELYKMLPNAGFIVSMYNNDVPRGEEKTLAELMNQQMIGNQTLRDYVLKNERLPPCYDYLIINDSCCEGMNLHDDRIKTVVCESPEVATIIQVMGRVRGDISNLIVCFAGYQYRDYETTAIESLNRFLAGIESPEYLKGIYDGQQAVIEAAANDHKKPRVDIKVFQDSTGTIQPNPFYEPIIRYEWDMVQRLRDDASMRSYFANALSDYSYNNVGFLGAGMIRNALCAAGRNSESSNNLIHLLGMDETSSKLFTSKELTNIANQHFIKPTGKDKAGKKTLIQAIEQHPSLDIQKLGQKTINGVRAIYYEVQKTGG